MNTGVSREDELRHLFNGLSWDGSRRRSGGQWRCPLSATPHFASILRVSSWVSDEVGGNLSFHAKGRQASMIAFECEVRPAIFFSAGIRGSSAELQASRIISICSDGSQRVVTAHNTSARFEG